MLATSPPPPTNTHPKTSTSMQQLVELQSLLLRDARDPNLAPIDRSQVARAWKELEYLKRDMKYLPKAKPIDVLPPLRGPGGRLMRKCGKEVMELMAPIEVSDPVPDSQTVDAPEAISDQSVVVGKPYSQAQSEDKSC